MSGKQEEIFKDAYKTEANYLKNATKDVIDFDNYMSDKSVKTRVTYLVTISKFKEWINKDIHDLSFTDFNDYMNKVKYLESGKESSRSRRITNYAALKIYCKVLYLQKIIPENYMEQIPRPKFKESEEAVKKREIGYLKEDEIVLVLTELKKDKSWYGIRDMAIFQVFLNTGMRSSALRGINVEDYDPVEGKIINTDKGSKVNTYYLSEDANDYVKKYLAKRLWKMGETDDCDTNALFLDRDECFWGIEEEHEYYIKCTRISAHMIGKIVKKRTKVIGRELSPHKLRATYGTMLYNQTHDIYFVQKMMNHNSPTTTELYIRGEGNRTKDASEIMTNILKGV